MSPFRLYFIVSALFFLVFSLVHYDVAIMHDLAMGIEQLHPAHDLVNSGENMATGIRNAGNMFNYDMAHMKPQSGLPADSIHDRAHRHLEAVEKTSSWFVKNQTVITFLLVPIVALLLKLIYISSRRLYIEHLVFAVHLQTFMFVILLPSLLPFARNWTYIAALIISAGYLFLAMMTVYKQHPIATIAKCGVMLVSYLAIMILIAYVAFMVYYHA